MKYEKSVGIVVNPRGIPITVVHKTDIKIAPLIFLVNNAEPIVTPIVISTTDKSSILPKRSGCTM